MILVGQNVKHSEHGKGIVKGVETSNLEALVKFESGESHVCPFSELIVLGGRASAAGTKPQRYVFLDLFRAAKNRTLYRGILAATYGNVPQIIKDLRGEGYNITTVEQDGKPCAYVLAEEEKVPC